MIETRYIRKYRDNNNKITAYLLQDMSGITRQISPNELKYLINKHELNVINLKLTSDARIIDDSSYKLKHNVKYRLGILINKITMETGLRFNPNFKISRINNDNFYVEALALEGSPLIKVGLKNNRNIIRIVYRESNNSKNSHMHVKFDEDGYNKLISIITAK